jgi:hypothetical protein
MISKNKQEQCHPVRSHNFRTPWLTLAFVNQECLEYVIDRIRYYSIAMPKTNRKRNEKVVPNVTTRTSIYKAYIALDLLFVYVLVMRMTLKVSS